MGQLQCEEAGVGWDVGGGSRELYMISSASSPACGGGGGGTSQRESLVLSLLPGKRHPAPCKQYGAALHLPERSDSGPELPVCWDAGFGETGLSSGRHGPICSQVMEIKLCSAHWAS